MLHPILFAMITCITLCCYLLASLRGSHGKESTCNVGDLGSIPGLGRSPGKGNSYPLQYSGLENSMDRVAWQGTVHGFSKRHIQVTFTFTYGSTEHCSLEIISNSV